MSQWDNAGPVIVDKSQSVVPAINSPSFPTKTYGETSDGVETPTKVTPTGATITANAVSKFRDAYETYVPGQVYTETKAAGDIVQAEGNTASASYLVISKSPFTQGSETILESIGTFAMPLDASFGIHMSQRTVGQEFSVEIVDTDPGIPNAPELDIATLAQATTTLTVSTATPHGMSAGFSFGVYGCPDSRLNYPALVVATVVNDTQFTATAGPGGAIPSVTASYSVAGMKVYQRRRLGGANDGTSMIFENTSATNASIYVRSNSGDALPSGTTLATNHSVTVATTTSVQLVTASNAYAFAPTSEQKLNMAIDRVQWHDQSRDVASGSTQRAFVNSVCPNAAKQYKLRYRFPNLKALTVPTNRIVQIQKTGTTTATVTFAEPHNFTAGATGDLIVAYGVRDQTNFPNLTTATQIVSAPPGNTITVVWGATTPTTTSYGGYVSRVNGGVLQQGAIAQVIQSASIAAGVLTLTGSGNWAGLVIGDNVNVYGCRDNVTGADMGLDGVYKVSNFSTTSLVLTPIAGTTIPSTLVSTNCGGGVIKRTEARISWARILDFERERVEFTPRPSGDLSIAVPVQGTVTASVSSATVAGTVAVDTAIGNPITVGMRASNANIAAMSATGDNVGWLGTMIGVGVVRPYAIPEADWQTPSNIGGILNTATALTVKEAAGTGIRNYVTALDLVSEALTNATDFRIREPDLTCSSQTIASNTLTVSATHNLSVGDAVVFTASTVTGITAGVTYYVLTTPAATTLTLSATRGGATLTISGTAVTATFHKVLWQTRIPTTGRPAGQIVFPTPLRGSPNVALQVQTATASGAGAVYPNLQGFVAP
jgi:hypothetical protein